MNANPMNDFQRTIDYGVRTANDGRMILSSRLRDRFHDIAIEIVADIATLEILASRVEFRRAPTPHCPKVAGKCAQLHSFVIGRGLSRKLNEVFGGPDGCGNLRVMLAGLLPLAINLHACAGLDDEEAALAAIHDKLLGTCAGYPQ
jgi:hypothetical protein